MKVHIVASRHLSPCQLKKPSILCALELAMLWPHNRRVSPLRSALTWLSKGALD